MKFINEEFRDFSFSNLNLSIELTGVISTAVPVRKASSQCFKKSKS